MTEDREALAEQGRAELFRLKGGPAPCPWCDSQDHWSGRINGCPSRAARMVVKALDTLPEAGEGWETYALRLRKQLSDEAERVA